LFITCSTLEQASRFHPVEDLGVRKTHKDITEMAKRMASRTQAEGQMLLGTFLIKRLQLRIWWIRDNAIYRNGDLSSMQQDSPLRLRVRNDNKLRRKVLRRFDPNDFDAYEEAFLKHHEDAFLKLLKDDFDAHEDAFLNSMRTLSSSSWR
jgi:hypothetical protein